jgi:hypothetical protein
MFMIDCGKTNNAECKAQGWSYKIANYSRLGIIKSKIHHTLLIKKGNFAFSVAISYNPQFTNVTVKKEKVSNTYNGYLSFLYAPNVSAMITAPDIQWSKYNEASIQKQGQLFDTKKYKWDPLLQSHLNLLYYIINKANYDSETSVFRLFLPQDVAYKPWYSNKHLSCRAFTCQFRDNPTKLLETLKRVLQNKNQLTPKETIKLLERTGNTYSKNLKNQYSKLNNTNWENGLQRAAKERGLKFNPDTFTVEKLENNKRTRMQRLKHKLLEFFTSKYNKKQAAFNTNAKNKDNSFWKNTNNLNPGLLKRLEYLLLGKSKFQIELEKYRRDLEAKKSFTQEKLNIGADNGDNVYSGIFNAEAVNLYNTKQNVTSKQQSVPKSNHANAKVNFN